MSLSVRSRTCELYPSKEGRTTQETEKYPSVLVHPNTRMILVVIPCIILFGQSIELQSHIPIRKTQCKTKHINLNVTT